LDYEIFHLQIDLINAFEALHP